MRLALLLDEPLEPPLDEVTRHVRDLGAQLRRAGHACWEVRPDGGDPETLIAGVSDVLRREACDVFMVSSSCPADVAVEVQRLGIRVVAHLHAAGASHRLKLSGAEGSSPASLVEATLLERADGVISPSRALGRDLMAAGISARRWYDCPLGVDYARRPPRPPRAGRKELHVAFEGPPLPGWEPHHITGRRIRLSANGDPLGHGSDEASVLSPRETGDDAGLDSLLHETDLLALPSVRFGMCSMPALIAVASGVPLIAPDVDGMREMLHGHRCGFSFSPEDPDALTELLERLGADPELVREVGREMQFPAGIEDEAWLLEKILAEVVTSGDARRPLPAPAVLPPIEPATILLGGAIDRPEPGKLVPRSPLSIEGWALMRPGPVARVEVSVDGAVAGLARLGMSRLDIAGISDAAEAPVCGFEYRLDLSQVPAETSRVTFGAAAVGADGTSYTLAPVEVLLEPKVEIDPEDVGRAEELQARFRKVVGRARRQRADEVRLVAFTHDLGYGGAQLYLWEMIRRLAPEPWFSCTVVSPIDGPLRRHFEAAGIPVHVTAGYPVHGVGVYEGKLVELGVWAKHENFNLALGNTLLAFPGIDLASRMGIPSVWAIHESYELPIFSSIFYPSTAPMHPLVATRVESALASAAAVVFEADATRHMFEAYGDPRRFLTIPYGIDLSDIDAYRSSFDRGRARHRHGIPLSASVLLCLGTIEPRKSQTVIAQALRHVAGDHPEAFCVFVGDLGIEYSHALHLYLQDTELAGRSLILPIVPDTYDWYGLSDVFVCASDLESLPRSVLEAMAFDLPVAATSVFGLAELIDDGRTGYLCEPRDVGALARLLDRVLSMAPADRRAVGRAGGRLVRERHDSGGYARTYSRLFRALMDDPLALPREILQAEPEALPRDTAIC